MTEILEISARLMLESVDHLVAGLKDEGLDEMECLCLIREYTFDRWNSSSTCELNPKDSVTAADESSGSSDTGCLGGEDPIEQDDLLLRKLDDDTVSTKGS